MGSKGLARHHSLMMCLRWWQLALAVVVLPVLASEETALIETYLRAYYIPWQGDSYTKFAQSLAKLGDVDGGGVADIAAGTPYDGTTNDGLLVLMFLKTSGSWSDHNTMGPADLGIEAGNRARLGYGLARIDDRNGDGVVDLAVSSIGERPSSPYPEGCVHLVQLTTAGAVTGAVQHLNGSFHGVSAQGANFGWAVAAGGDWSGLASGEHDLLVGAPGHREPGRSGTGCVLLLVPGVQPDNPRAARVCAGDVSPADEGAAAQGLGASLAHLGGRSVAAGAALGGNQAEGALWLLTLNATMGVEKAVVLQTEGLGLANGDGFGSAVAVLSSAELEDEEGCSSDGTGWDWDRNCATLDLAVGAPFMDGVYGDSDFLDSGVVFLLTVHASTGVVVKHYALKNFDGVPYYTGGPITNLLGKKDYFGSSLACLGDLDSDGDLELMAGAPGYSNSVGNSRGGAWVNMFLQQPTPAPTLETTVSHQPTAESTPRPSHAPSLSPTSASAASVEVSFTMAAAAAPTAADAATLKTTVATALSVGEGQLKRFAVAESITAAALRRRLLAVEWAVTFTVTTDLTDDATNPTDFGSAVASVLASASFAASVAAALANATVDASSVAVVVLTRRPSLAPVPQPTLGPTSTAEPSRRPTPQPSPFPTRAPTHAPTHKTPPSQQPTHAPTADVTSQPTAARAADADLGAAGFTVLAWFLGLCFAATVCFVSIRCAKALLDPDPGSDDEDGDEAQRRRSAATETERQRHQVASIPVVPFEQTQTYAKAGVSAPLITARGLLGRKGDADGGEEAKQAPDKVAKEAELCAICLAELEVGEACKELACGHCYHALCLDEWLRRARLCPLCKRRAVAPPGGTRVQGGGSNVSPGANAPADASADGSAPSSRRRSRPRSGTAAVAPAPSSVGGSTRVPSEAWLARFLSAGFLSVVAGGGNRGAGSGEVAPGGASRRVFDPDHSGRQRHEDSTEGAATEVEMATVGVGPRVRAPSGAWAEESEDEEADASEEEEAVFFGQDVDRNSGLPPGMRRVAFGPPPIGLTIAAARDEGGNNSGLVVTHSQRGGQAWRGGVRAGFMLVELNGELLGSGVGDQSFRDLFAALPRPVVLGFSRTPLPSSRLATRLAAAAPASAARGARRAAELALPPPSHPPPPLPAPLPPPPLPQAAAGGELGLLSDGGSDDELEGVFEGFALAAQQSTTARAAAVAASESAAAAGGAAGAQAGAAVGQSPRAAAQTGSHAGTQAGAAAGRAAADAEPPEEEAFFEQLAAQARTASLGPAKAPSRICEAVL